jgi:hypothetical protein
VTLAPHIVKLSYRKLRAEFVKSYRIIKIKLYRTVILLVLLYGCETWSLTLREEHRLRVSENRMLRELFGTKKNEVTGERRKPHDKRLYGL